MKDARYAVGETVIGSDSFATVFDTQRRERFCLVDPVDCAGGMDTARARALDIVELFNNAPRISAELERLQAVVNTPVVADFVQGVTLEAAHQRERWPSDHDAGKSPFDWFWLLGYLGQKAAAAAVAGDVDKAKHHTISTAAACANWHLALTGVDTSMRPGIETPAGEA